MTARTYQTYNIYALVGLLLGKLFLFGVLIYYCCMKRKEAQRRGDISVSEESLGGFAEVSKDQPPAYADIIEDENPPKYIDSILNEEINPEINKDWALDLQKRVVAPEVEEVITRSRHSSMGSQKPKNDASPRGSSRIGNGRSPSEENRRSQIYWIGVA